MKFMRIGCLLFLSFILCGCVSSNSSKQIRFALASARGDTSLVKEFVKDGNVDINAVNGKIGPALVSASYGGHNEVVKLLLNNQADIDIRDEKGTTALMNAIIGEKVETVKLLLERGADPNIVFVNENGEKTEITAITFAKLKQNKEIIDLIERVSLQNQ